jgi:hypothetical protein
MIHQTKILIKKNNAESKNELWKYKKNSILNFNVLFNGGLQKLLHPHFLLLPVIQIFIETFL